MKHYASLLEKGCFSREELIQIVKTEAAAKSLIREYQKKGLIERVKRDFYVVISLETKQPLLSRYQIGTNLFPDACMSHHSAFEVYGYGNQVFYKCYVATKSRFNDFEYNGVTYHRMERKPGTETINTGRIRVTSIEQTVVDSIRDFEKVAGLEEILRCMMLIPGLNEEKILECIRKNQNGFLYQKCGYIFEQLKEEFGFSENFFRECEENSANSKRYLMKDTVQTVFNERWKLYVPISLTRLIDKGVFDFDAL